MGELLERTDVLAREEAAEGWVAEVPLLLSSEDAAALEEAAWREGLTAGQVLRRLIQDFLHGSERGE